MGWYHDASFTGFDDGGEAAPSCPINSAGETAINAPAASTSASTSNTVSGDTACPLPPSSPPLPPPPDVESIYHLCQKSQWREAKARRQPYFPPTFVKDGKFTRASVYKDDLVSTANLYYKENPGDWVVLEINCMTLFGLGIPILAQDAPESTPKQTVKCLQVFGGISTTLPGLITKMYGMKRNASGEFLKILEPPASKKNCGCCKKDDEKKKEEESPKNRREQAKPASSEKPKQKSRRFWPKLKSWTRDV
jgi:hypothetical protein